MHYRKISLIIRQPVASGTPLHKKPGVQIRAFTFDLRLQFHSFILINPFTQPSTLNFCNPMPNKEIRAKLSELNPN